jgi:hypothetical protein
LPMPNLGDTADDGFAAGFDRYPLAEVVGG